MEIKGQDEGAPDGAMDWDAVWKRYQPEVHKYIYRLVHDTRDADDLTMVAFERAWKRMKHHDPNRGSMITWLQINAKSAAIDFLRRQKGSRREPELRLDLMPEDCGPSVDGPGELLAMEEAKRIVDDAIRSLPGPMALVMRCRHILGMRWREVAAAAQMSVRNVQYLEERGRVLLKGKLSGVWPGAGFLHGPAGFCG